MGGTNREGERSSGCQLNNTPLADPSLLGGKVKPLKQAKKANKDLDDDDKAFLEKKRAGTTT